jgi:hypothetical protein
MNKTATACKSHAGAQRLAVPRATDDRSPEKRRKGSMYAKMIGMVVWRASVHASETYRRRETLPLENITVKAVIISVYLAILKYGSVSCTLHPARLSHHKLSPLPILKDYFYTSISPLTPCPQPHALQGWRTSRELR